MYNTPPCWAIYMAGLTFAKLRRDGGLGAALAANETARACWERAEGALRLVEGRRRL